MRHRLLGAHVKCPYRAKIKPPLEVVVADLVVCGFIASMLAASVSMLVAAKMHTISVAVCIPFFLYCLLPFIGRALSGYTVIFNLIPTILTNVEASAKVPLIYQIGNHVFRQIPLVMVMYTVVAVALIPFIYKSFHSYGNK